MAPFDGFFYLEKHVEYHSYRDLIMAAIERDKEGLEKSM